MTSDPNKKTTRTFQCRDPLWQKFEQMARELECSVDYLINDAMKQYARQRGYGAAAVTGQSLVPPVGGATTGVPPAPAPSAPAHAPPPAAPAAAVAHAPPPAVAVALTPPIAPLPPPPGRAVPAAPPPPSALPPPPTAAGRPPPAGAKRPLTPPPPPATTGARKAPPPLGASRSVAAPAPPLAARAASAAAGTGALSISYQGERFQVTKDRFIIGRGKQTSDLTIKDPNVSRQHAMIEFSNGQYYIVDMGSTNGVEYGGQRVQRKVINDGDTFKVCDHELHFSFQ